MVDSDMELEEKKKLDVLSSYTLKVEEQGTAYEEDNMKNKTETKMEASKTNQTKHLKNVLWKIYKRYGILIYHCKCM